MAETLEDINGDQRNESQSDRPTSSPASEQPAPTTAKSTSEIKHLNLTKMLKLPKFNLRVPRLTIKLPIKISLDRPASSPKPHNWLLLWLSIILISYACVGYFLSVLLTIPARQSLAIAGFMIMAVLPIVTAYADYALMKWGYLISGVLIISAFIFLLKLKTYLLLLSIITWVGITTIACVGEHLLSKKKRFMFTVALLTAPCLVGLALGWQIWRLAVMLLS
ncbi:MAG: hypothetical protein NW214_15820 [Pseudanabaenaceae cyanobacterium bins.39]|nr:hypothetical protein [Pseudanabaenaceae cyanobacterium bins.39]